MIGQEIQWVAVVGGKERGLTKRMEIEPKKSPKIASFCTLKDLKNRAFLRAFPYLGTRKWQMKNTFFESFVVLL